MPPWTELAASITSALAAAAIKANVYGTLSAKISPPGVLVRPDEPWITPASFEHYLERYLAVCFVSSTSPAEATVKLAAMVDATLEALELEPSWGFDQVSAPRLDDSTGVTFLAAAISINIRRPIPMEV